MIRAHSLSYTQILSQEESFLQFIRKIISEIVPDPQGYFFVTSFIVVGVTLRFGYKYINHVFLYVIFFYCAFSYFTFNNIVRQGVAVSFVTIAYTYLVRKKKLLFLFYVLLSVLIHRSAIIAIVMLFLVNLRISRRSLFGYITFIALMIVANRPITQLLIIYIYPDYATSGYGTTSAAYYYVVYVALALIAVIQYARYYDCFDDNWVIRGNRQLIENEAVDGNRVYCLAINGTIVYGVFVLLSFLNMLIFFRMSLYFVPCLMVTLDHALNAMPEEKRSGYLFACFIFAIGIFIVLNMNGKLIPTPYTVFWDFPFRMTY